MDAARFVPGFAPEIPSGDAHWALFRGTDLLIKMLPERRARLLRTAEVEALALPIVRFHFVGALDGVPCIAGTLADDAAPVEGCQFAGLRVAYGKLEEVALDVAMLAYQIQYWDGHYRFCAGCGGPLVLKTTERAKRCDACARDFYPPVVPAIIVRVERGDSVLLTRQSRFPKGMYGLVAGFLEPGETLEQCVAREVLEETGIVVRDVRYFGSQQWPFPHQVMVAFTAAHASGEIVVDTSELEEAAWFARDAMPMLPPPLSIARRLLDDWLGHGDAEYPRS